MSDTKKPASTPIQPEAKTAARSAQRSPAYPAFALPAAIERIRKVWDAQRKHEAHIDAVLNAMGYANKSGPALRAIGALNHYSLIEESGSKDDRRIKVSELAQDILHLPDEDPRRKEALKKSALNPTIHATLWERYGTHLPDDAAIKSFLVRDKGYNESVVSDVITNYRTSFEFAKIDTMGDSSSQDDPSKNQIETDVSRNPANPTRTPTPMTYTATSQELPILVGEGKIARIPFPMTEEDYNLFLETLKVWKKRLVPSLSATPTQEPKAEK